MTVNICFATDTKYAPFCGVAISSLKKNISHKNVYHIYVLYDRLLLWYRKQFEKMSNENFVVTCICVHDYFEGFLFEEVNHLSIAAIYRLVIPPIFNNLERVLYLDSDVIINADIAKLYNVDMGNALMGASHGKYDSSIEKFMKNHIYNTLHIDEDSFFNSGVLLFDINKCKEFNITEKCIELLKTKRGMIYADQDALNIVCKGRIYYFDGYWNYEVVVNSILNEKHRTDMEYPDSGLYGIIHFDGTIKPWNEPDSVLSELFWEHARETVFYEEILSRKNAYVSKKIFFLNELLHNHKRISVYGAGKIGKNVVKWIHFIGDCKISQWIDRSELINEDSIIPVVEIDKLDVTNVDGILIAIGDEDIAIEVENMLLNLGVHQNMIIKVQEEI